MVAIVYGVVRGLQESWKVMLPMLLMTPFQSAIETAPMLAMIAHEPSDVHYTRPISSNRCEENLRSQFALERSIPDPQPLLLKANQMLKPGEQERVKILWIIRTRNKATNKHMVLLVL